MTTHSESIDRAMLSANLDPRNPEARETAEALVAAYIEGRNGEAAAWAEGYTLQGVVSVALTKGPWHSIPLFLAPSAGGETVKALEGWVYDPDHPMSDGGDTRMTAAEEVLAYLLIEVNGSPDDVPYSPNEAQLILETRLKEGRKLEVSYAEHLDRRRASRSALVPHDEQPTSVESQIGADSRGNAKEWRCFHCDDVFTTEHQARVHFGCDEMSEPACKIKMGAEGSLVTALRRAEADLADAWAAIHNESTEAAKAYYAQQSRHQEQLRAAEELGYERGLADGRATSSETRKENGNG